MITSTRAASVFALAAALLTHAAPSNAQDPLPSRTDRVQWLQQHAAPIRSTDPADEDFSDLAPLGAAIGKARVVMLGEQSHEDGTTFLAKTRIVKYLHEKLGFDVLAMEHGFYDVPKAWPSFVGGADSEPGVMYGVFGYWSNISEVQPLRTYVARLANSASPLELTGFDVWLRGQPSERLLHGDLSRFLTGHGIDTMSVGEWSSMMHVLDVLSGTVRVSVSSLSKDMITDFLGQWGDLRRRVDNLAGQDTSVTYWRQLLKSIYALATVYNGGIESEARDPQMADNLLWLAREKYPDRKIIVWAHTGHIVRNPREIDVGTTRDPELGNQKGTSMGHVVSSALRDGAYLIGFIASEGSYGWQQTKPIPTPAAGSLEDLFAATSFGNAFVDFRALYGSGKWLRQPLVAGPSFYYPWTANWTRVFDGLVYTRRMTPITRSRPVPTNRVTPPPSRQ